MWHSIGDIDPKQGTTLIDTDSFDLTTGDLYLEAISVAPESDIGGCDTVFRIQSGTIFLSKDKFQAALEVIGADLADGMISTPGADASFSLESDMGRMTLATAAEAFTGIEDPDFSQVVRIGLPSRIDQDPKFEEDPVIYPEGTSIWAIMRNVVGEFEHAELHGVPVAAPHNTFYGEMEGMPRTLSDRSDLMQIAGFRNLDTDPAGNPLVWESTYAHDDCAAEAGGSAWEMETAVPCDDACMCGAEISPTSSRWIGPESPELVALWEELEPAEPKDEPDNMPSL